MALRDYVTNKLLSELLPRDLVDDLIDKALNNYKLRLEAFGRKLDFGDISLVVEMYDYVGVKCHPGIYFVLAVMRIVDSLGFKPPMTIFEKCFQCTCIKDDVYNTRNVMLLLCRPLNALYAHMVTCNVMSDKEIQFYTPLIEHLMNNMRNEMPDYYMDKNELFCKLME